MIHTDPDLIDILNDLGDEPHAIAREEVFDSSSIGPGPDMVLYRCKCGGLYGSTAIHEHIADPVGSWQRLPAAYRELVKGKQ